MVKDVPADLAEITAVVTVVLQVTPSLAPRDESNCTNICELAETVVVLTTVLVVPAETMTLPADEAEQSAGDAVASVQFPDVP